MNEICGDGRVVAWRPHPAVEGVRQLGVVGDVKVVRGDPLLGEQVVFVIVTISPQNIFCRYGKLYFTNVSALTVKYGTRRA